MERPGPYTARTMRSTLAQLAVAVATVLCLLAVPVVAPGGASQAPAAGIRHHQAPYTGAFNVITGPVGPQPHGAARRRLNHRAPGRDASVMPLLCNRHPRTANRDTAVTGPGRPYGYGISLRHLPHTGG